VQPMHAPHVGQLVAVRVGLAADGDERGGARAQGHHSSGGPAVRQAMSRAMLAVVRARRRAQDEPPRGTCFPRGRAESSKKQNVNTNVVSTDGSVASVAQIMTPNGLGFKNKDTAPGPVYTACVVCLRTTLNRRRVAQDEDSGLNRTRSSLPHSDTL
jgi:hypothetical protein